MNENECDYLIKLIIIGESGVGKTCLMNSFCTKEYDNYYMTTIGVDFKTKIFRQYNKNIKLQIWDTAGQEKYHAITTSYYRGAHIIMLVFDVTNSNSFIKLEKWLLTIKNIMTNSNYKIILVGNKCDQNNAREVSTNEISKFTTTHNINYIEVSAKKNINVENAFLDVTNSVITSLISSVEKKQCTMNGSAINSCCGRGRNSTSTFPSPILMII